MCAWALQGGAIYSTGSLTVQDCTFSDNQLVRVKPLSTCCPVHVVDRGLQARAVSGRVGASHEGCRPIGREQRCGGWFQLLRDAQCLGGGAVACAYAILCYTTIASDAGARPQVA